MSRRTRIGLGLVVMLLAYLLLWPVSLSPVAWRAPTFGGYQGPHAQNSRLAAARQVSIAPEVGPEHIVFGPDGRLYVTTEITNSIKVIDPRTNSVVGTLPTDQKESHMLALSGDGRTAYTSNVGAGTVSVIDVATRKVTAVVTVAARAQRIALSVDGGWVFTADQDSPRLAVIDTKTNKLAPGVALPGVAYGTAPTPDGRFLIMALPGLNQVGVLDLQSMEVVRTLDVPKAPQEVLVRPDGRVAYVSCDASGQVAVIDLAEWKVERLIPAGPMVDGLAWAAGR